MDHFNVQYVNNLAYLEVIFFQFNNDQAYLNLLKITKITLQINLTLPNLF